MLVVTLASCCGLCVLLTGWKRKFAGMALGSLIIASGLLVLALISRTVPRYWWICLPPLLLGLQSIRVWKQEPPIRGVRLNTLLLVLGFIAAMCGGIGHLYRQRQAEKPVITKLESLVDGQIERDPDGLASGLILFEVKEDVLDETLALAVQLPYVRRFQLHSGRISPERAKQIGQLANLQQLWLQSTDLGDDALAPLGRLKRLKTLDLLDTQVTGDGLKHLEKSTALRHLWLSTDKISPRDVQRLRSKLPDLEVSY